MHASVKSRNKGDVSPPPGEKHTEPVGPAIDQRLVPPWGGEAHQGGSCRRDRSSGRGVRHRNRNRCGTEVPNLHTILTCGFVPPAGLEPAHPAPEAGALSSELRGPGASSGPGCPTSILAMGPRG